jgi:uncharacterized protein (DUF302 family)
MFNAEGVITRSSPYSVPETLDRLEALLRAKNISVFVRVDHSGEAEKAGLSMPPTQLLIFGNPKGGTPVMLANPLSAIDLPLKALAWQDASGTNFLSWIDPQFLKQRFTVPQDVMAPIESLSTLIAQALVA